MTTTGSGATQGGQRSLDQEVRCWTFTATWLSNSSTVTSWTGKIRRRAALFTVMSSRPRASTRHRNLPRHMRLRQVDRESKRTPTGGDDLGGHGLESFSPTCNEDDFQALLRKQSGGGRTDAEAGSGDDRFRSSFTANRSIPRQDPGRRHAVSKEQLIRPILDIDSRHPPPSAHSSRCPPTPGRGSRLIHARGAPAPDSSGEGSGDRRTASSAVFESELSYHAGIRLEQLRDRLEVGFGYGEKATGHGQRILREGSPNLLRARSAARSPRKRHQPSSPRARHQSPRRGSAPCAKQPSVTNVAASCRLNSSHHHFNPPTATRPDNPDPAPRRHPAGRGQGDGP